MTTGYKKWVKINPLSITEHYDDNVIVIQSKRFLHNIKFKVENTVQGKKRDTS